MTRTFVASAMLGFLVAGCDGSAGVTDDGSRPGRVEVTPATAQLPVGGSTSLEASAYTPDGARIIDAVFTWSSDDVSVASVTGDGQVTAVSVGSATITATANGLGGSAEVVVAPALPTGTTIDVWPAVEYQSIVGWEATSQYGALSCAAPYAAYSNALLDRAVNELGLNRVRLEVRSGVENPIDWYARWEAGEVPYEEYRQHRYEIINDNGDPGSINPAGFGFRSVDHVVDDLINPLRQRLAARGEQLYVNLNYVDFGNSAFEHSTGAEEYAELMLATFQHLQTKYGWVPDAVELILEPDNTQNWRPQTIAAALVAAGDRLRSAGFEPDFIAPSNANMGGALQYFDELVGKARVSEYLTDLAYHRYSGVSSGTLESIGNRAVQYGLRTAMLEKIGSTYHDLHADLTAGRVSSWQQFTLAFCESDNGAQYYVLDDSNPASPQLILSNTARYLRHYFLYARRGAVRIGAASGDGRFDPVAFRNPNGRVTVVVKASAGGTFDVRHLPAGTYGVFYTTASQADVRSPDVTIGAGASLTASIPAAGVITIHGR